MFRKSTVHSPPDGATGARRHDHVVKLAIALLDDLLGSAFVVRERVASVLVLIEDLVRILRRKLVVVGGGVILIVLIVEVVDGVSGLASVGVGVSGVVVATDQKRPTG